MQQIPRPEYPRPQFVRGGWENLNGEWEFSFDQPVFDRKILVPFCYQSELSGIHDETDHLHVFYRRKFTVPAGEMKEKRLMIHFGAVDYEARVWVNGKLAGTHQGGNLAFSFDITELVSDGENTVTVQATDSQSQAQPRGKQSWRGEHFGCWYTPTTGIWQTVWLEYLPEAYIKYAKFTPDVDRLEAGAEVYVSSDTPATVSAVATIERNGSEVVLARAELLCRHGYGKGKFCFDDDGVKMWDDLLWSPKKPNLIRVKLTLEESGDQADTYFGMRKISYAGGNILLNNEVLYQRLILDQGYWKESLLTPPSDEAIRKDLELTLAMGFNGARKHQKIEDPRYYYWADKMGVLVWGEMPSTYEFSSTAQRNTLSEMTEFVESHYNHPSIITWVPVNESWGVSRILSETQQQNFAKGLYYTVKSLDPTRLISINDGWEQLSDGDFCAIHDYKLFPDNLDKYDDMDKLLSGAMEHRQAYADGDGYRAGQPVLMTEYGGIAFDFSVNQEGEAFWGYYGAVKSEKEFLDRLVPINRMLMESGKFCGYCYTQLTDVMQEVNGLLTMDREPKLPLETLYKIFTGSQL